MRASIRKRTIVAAPPSSVRRIVPASGDRPGELSEVYGELAAFGFGRGNVGDGQPLVCRSGSQGGGDSLAVAIGDDLVVVFGFEAVPGQTDEQVPQPSHVT